MKYIKCLLILKLTLKACRYLIYFNLFSTRANYQIKIIFLFQAIDEVKQPGDHKVIDIFLLLILHTTNRKKSVESLVRNKIRLGGITEALLQDVFSNHYEVRNEIFRSYENENVETNYCEK
jgi:hypothetical protein